LRKRNNFSQRNTSPVKTGRAFDFSDEQNLQAKQESTTLGAASFRTPQDAATEWKGEMREAMVRLVAL
jgi:hypothetical protein